MPASSVSPTADTPLKMASASRARLRNVDGWIMAVLLLGGLWAGQGSALQQRPEPTHQPHWAERLAYPALDRLHLNEHENAGVVHHGFGHVQRACQQPGGQIERPRDRRGGEAEEGKHLHRSSPVPSR